jgi:hypothetical protein
MNFRVRESTLPSLQLTGVIPRPPEITDNLNSKFDLALEFTVTPAGFGGFFEYSTDLFEEATVRRFRDDLEAILRVLLVNPAAPIKELAAVCHVARLQEKSELGPGAVGVRAAKRQGVHLAPPENTRDSPE